MGNTETIGITALESRLAPGMCKGVAFAPGDELRRKDNHYADMYLIVSGRVEIQLDTDVAPIVVGPGSPVGEIGFLKGCRATATAVALEPTTALALDDEALWRIEREEPELSPALLRALASIAEARLSENLSLTADEESEDRSHAEILLCRSPEMLETALAMRYRVYCEELGRSSPYADHERKVIRDGLDDFGHTFIAVDEGRTIGTLRANLSSEGPLGQLEDLYGMTKSRLHPAHTMICTKFIVEKTRRGGSASMDLIGAMASYALKADARECYIDCIPKLVPLYRRIGFVPAGEMFFHYENGPSLPMFMDITRHGERLSRGVGR
jgi:CRP-like cAMP-binding protein